MIGIMSMGMNQSDVEAAAQQAGAIAMQQEAVDGGWSDVFTNQWRCWENKLQLEQIIVSCVG